MATRTYRIQGNPTFPYSTPNGTVISFNSDGTGYWLPDPGFNSPMPVNEFQVELLCNDVFVDTSDTWFTLPLNQNESFSYKITRNNCVTGTPTEVEYAVAAGLVTGVFTVQHLNWLAYLQSQAAAQTYANEEGDCINCTVNSEPCVSVAELGHMVINGTPGNIIKIYKRGLVLFEMALNEMGYLEIEHPGLIGEIYVTQTDSEGNESNPQCMPFILKDTTKKCCKKTKCSCND